MNLCVILVFLELCATIARMIDRRMLQTILKRLDQFPAVALLGPRQVGKTTLAEAVGAQRESIYLDLESQSGRERLSDPSDYSRRA